MTFLNPAGLWLLLGVPILIIIYIIKSRHEDRAVSSTFIWKLSERFMKKRIPLQKLRKILAFVLQLCMIVTVSLLVARPATPDEDGGREYVAIIDASASMLTENESGVSRFDRAVDYIENLATEVDSGSKLTVISASDDASYLVQRSQSQTEIRLVMRSAGCACGDSDIQGALDLAQLICDRYGNTEVILLTDRDYGNSENVRVVNLSDGEWNVTVSGVTYTKHSSGYSFTGNIVSNGKDASVSVALKIDGKIIDAQAVECKNGESVSVTFTPEDISDFDTAVLYTEPGDGLEADNSYAVCKKTVQESNVLIVSDAPFYLESVFGVMSDCKATAVSTSEVGELTGYSLYVFDGYVPDALPTDGSVWVINPDKPLDGMTEMSAVEGNATLSAPADNGAPFLITDISPEQIQISSYLKTEISDEWSASLYCDGNPVLFTKKETGGMRTTVMTFDIHDSNLALLSDYVVLVKNLIKASVPELMDETDYSVGEMVNITVLPKSEDLYVQNPVKAIERLNIVGDYTAYVPQDIGIYTAVATLENGSGQYVDFFVHIPSGESQSQNGDSVSVALSNEVQTDDSGENAYHELWFLLAAVLLILMLAEWGLYCYEQY